MEHRDGLVLVTGGSGFLGSHVVDALIAAGHFRVVATTRKSAQHRNPAAQYIAVDLTQHHAIAAAVEQLKPIAIVHTANPGPFARQSLHDKDHAATVNLVEVAQRSASVRAFVYSSSAEAMVNVSGARHEPLSESEAVLHKWASAPSAYARTKSASDAIVLQANGPHLATAVLRLPGMFGPRENPQSGIASSFIRTANTAVTRVQLGNNSVRHEWIYVKNAAHAHVIAVNALLDPQQHADGEAYFITDGTPIKLWDFFRKIWVAAGDKDCSRRRRIVVPWWVMWLLAVATEWAFRVFTLGRVPPPLTVLHINFMREGAWFDISKARGRLGYEPMLSTDDGIEETVAWYKQLSSAREGK